MKLQEFVSETLKEIIAGVMEAQAYARDNGANVNAPTEKIFPSAKEVEFDVAVTSTDTSETQASAGIFVAALGVGAKGKSDISNSCVSRVRFSVPIALPRQK